MVLSLRALALQTVVTVNFLLSFIIVDTCNAFVVQEPVSALLQTYADDITKLKQETQSIVGEKKMEQRPYNNDVFFLRYCVDDKGIDDLQRVLSWREGDGKAICEAAVHAVQKASSSSSSSRNSDSWKPQWDNTPVRDGAPNAAKINPYLTPTTTLTTSTSQGDLVYCIRAGLIDDVSLMKSLDSVDELVDFFLYCKEVNAIVANDRSQQIDQLLSVITVNDLDGLKLIGGDATFRQALSAASKQANDLYPALAGPTLLLNLPRLVSALVKLFTPLFPPEVQKRLKFERGPLQNVKELIDISYGGKDRESFLKDIDALCYQ
jgi:CRAL/TRIO domain